MNIKVAVTGGLILIVLLSLALFLIPAPEKESDVVSTSFEEKTDIAEITVKYPSLGYTEADEVLSEVVGEFVGDFKVAVEESGPSPSGRPYILVIEDQAVVESADTVGVLLLVYQDFGGAHGMPQLIGLNFYKDTGVQVSFEDVLARVNKTADMVAEGAISYFEETLGDSFFKDGAEVGEYNYKSFLIEGNTVTFYFQPYQVAAYALGPQEYTISY